jgi:hypothetical protein
MVSKDISARYEALEVLSAFPEARQYLVPEIIGALKDKNVNFARRYAIMLGELGAGAKDALPALRESQQSTNKRLSDASSEAIKKIEAALEKKN